MSLQRAGILSQYSQEIRFPSVHRSDCPIKSKSTKAGPTFADWQNTIPAQRREIFQLEKKICNGLTGVCVKLVGKGVNVLR